jgi:hypothetical protein
MAVALPREVCFQYERLSLYNSPYVAHERGHAIDLYPGPDTDHAPSPVAGEVLETKTVRAPPKPYAPEHDHLLLVDTGTLVARLLHVDPVVRAGEHVEVGDPLGTLVRAGFFAPWVDDHLHLEFRAPDANPYRASGSVRIELDLSVAGLAWDGSGTVVEVGETYATLDAPAHPAPGERFAGIAAAEGPVLDGGLVHYAGGGALGADGTLGSRGAGSSALSLLGERVGVAAGRDVEWAALDVLANGDPITGLSLFCARDADFGAKLVCPDHDFSVGDRIGVSLRPSEDPVRLG